VIAPELRPYQRDMLARIGAEIAAGRRRILVTLPTGAGKTVVAAALIAEAVARGERALFVAHRREIVAQTCAKLHAVSVDHGVIQAGFPSRSGAPVQVASIQTLHARAIRSRTLAMPEASLVFVDEAHHCRAQTYEAVLACYPDATVVGLTATPCRADGRGLGNVFGVLVEGPSVAELVAERHLVPVRVYAPSRPDLTGVRVERGDYVEAELARRVNTDRLVGDIIEHWLRLAERRRTVVFATGVAHSVHIRDRFRAAGVVAEHIDGATPTEDRDRILAALAAGAVDIVVNAMVLTEGWDRPEVSCLILARPTKSLGLYRQMVGRVLRPYPNKADALILDHAGAVFAHGLPDDPIAWALHADRRAKNTAHAARGTPHAPALTTCPECAAVRFAGRPCPACGWRPVPKPQAIETLPGELARVDGRLRAAAAAASPAEREQFYRELLWIARERGRQPGWAAHVYREKFGAWPSAPPWAPPAPMPAGPAVRAYVRSRDIAYATSQARRRA
jgi:DNA repair protein RadD